jgi:hypothetical protein
MGCSDPKKKKTCLEKCTDPNNECKTVGKKCECIPKTTKSRRKYKILYKKYLDDKNIDTSIGGGSVKELN